MKPPNPAAIRTSVPLSQHPCRGADPILACNVCGQPHEYLGVWREHDEHDLPIAGPEHLVFMGGGGHEKCKKVLDAHPRLYAEVRGDPGTFPKLCGPCVHRHGFECEHPKLKKNGGVGLLVNLDQRFKNAIICMGGGRRYVPIPHALECEGRTVDPRG